MLTCINIPVGAKVRLRYLLIAVTVVVLALGSLSTSAEGTFHPEEWTGGNGWCQGDFCFRAWPSQSGVELSWRVQGEPKAELSVIRLLPASAEVPEVVATSSGIGEFAVVDVDIQPGRIYVYELVAGEQSLGDPLEAGLSSEVTDPGGDGRYRVYLPLTLNR